MTVLVGLFMAVALYSLSSCRGTEKTVSEAVPSPPPPPAAWGRSGYWTNSGVPNSSLLPYNRMTDIHLQHMISNTSHKRRENVFLCLTDGEFVPVTWFGCWNMLEDVMQVGVLQALVDLTRSPGLLPSVMVRLNLCNACSRRGNT